MSHCIALMYHALYRNEEEWHALLDEEKPYAVSIQTFEMHLQVLQSLGRKLIDPHQLRCSDYESGIIVTFDDGHRSHLTHAVPILEKYNGKALFFLTTNFIDNDPRFCSWEDAQMLKTSGMLVHAHGHTHGFFEDMSDDSARHELKSSYELLERNVEKPWSMSFPGGRYTPTSVRLARAQGFSHIFTSEVNVIGPRAFSGEETIPRFAIKNATDLDAFKRMVNPSSSNLRKARAIAKLKSLTKKTLGNTMYHWLYTLKAGQGKKE